MPASTLIYREGPVIRGVSSRQLYIAPGGTDSGSGSFASPFATFAGAQAAISGAGFNAAGDVTVNVAPGTYFPPTFGPSDSGLNGNTVTYRCSGAPGTVVLSSAQVINPASWVNVSGSVYRAPIANPVFTMWENGKRGRAARLPKLAPGASFPAAFAPYFTAAGVNQAIGNVLQYNPVDFDPSPWTLADVRLFVWSTLNNIQIDWFTDTAQVTSLDTVAKQFAIANGGMKFQSMSGVVGARYVVQGALQMLTEAGEFVCTGGFLYYWARDGAIANQTITIPRTGRGVSFVGSSTTNRVSGIVLDGMTVQYTDFNTWYRFGAVNATMAGGGNDYAYQAQLPLARNGLVYIENADRITINRCQLLNAGFAGVYLREYAQQVTVANSLIDSVGTTGIYGEGRAPGSGDIFGSNYYYNNRIRKFGQLAGDGVAMRLNQSGNNTIYKGDFSVGPRHGLVLTGWSNNPLPPNNYTTANQVSYVKIANVGQDSGDMGALTCEFMDRTGVNFFSQITIDSVTAHASMLDTSPNGCFCDNKSDGQHLTNVQCTNIQGAQFRTNDSASHVLTNCSFQSDGTANPSFNAGLMDSANIGVSAENPYS